MNEKENIVNVFFWFDASKKKKVVFDLVLLLLLIPVHLVHLVHSTSVHLTDGEITYLLRLEKTYL